MSKLFRCRPSASLVISIMALFIAVTGSAVAATKLVSGNNLIKPNSLSGNRLKNETLTGKQINLNQLGTVPNATNAVTATNATNAVNATNATNATSSPISKVTYSQSTGTIPESNGVTTGAVQITASCPTGTYVIGGGGSVANESDGYVNDSAPSGETGWIVTFDNTSTANTVGATVTAICAPAASTAT